MFSCHFLWLIFSLNLLCGLYTGYQQFVLGKDGILAIQNTHPYSKEINSADVYMSGTKIFYSE